MRLALSTGWARIGRGGRSPQDEIGDRWVPVLESMWSARFAALDASCAAAGRAARPLGRAHEEIRHD
jgi:hypothetical protein